ncbi:MAG: serine/threonine protein kinase [Planctomycetia bacterium]|nr:serine/threonine protein kinase [Planctomycetia bacterium]
MARVVYKPFSFDRQARMQAAAQPGDGGASQRAGEWQLGAKLCEHAGVEVVEARPVKSRETRYRYVVKRWTSALVSTEQQALLRREALAGNAVNSPHVVPILSAHVHEAPFYYVMPRLEGTTLDEIVLRCGRLSVATALWYGRQAAEGLAALHDAGWLHADVKPSNLFVGPDGHVTLIDLGYARRRDDESNSESQCVLGTVDYLAPEAICSRLRVDERSDLYSLGIVLYRLLGGRLPFVGATPAEIVAAHVSAEPQPLRELVSSLPNDVCGLVRRLLHKQPARRHDSAHELVAELTALEIAYLDER